MCRPLTKNNIQVNLGKYSLNISIKVSKVSIQYLPHLHVRVYLDLLSIGIIFYNKDNLTKTLQIYQTSMHY